MIRRLTSGSSLIEGMHTKNKTIQLTNTSVNSIDSEINLDSAAFNDDEYSIHEDANATLSLANDDTETTEMLHLPDE